MTEIYYIPSYDKLILVDKLVDRVLISEDGIAWFMFDEIAVDSVLIGEL